MKREQQVVFERDGIKLFGVLHDAAETDAGSPVVIFLSGWSGSRLGPHRMFVKAARRLSAEGFRCLRFDFAGRGNSEGSTSGATISSMTEDAGAAMDYLQERHGFSKFILLGICSGGKVAISRASTDDRVKQLVLWSAEPMGYIADGSRDSRKRFSVLGEYLKKLMKPATWRRAMTGQVNTRMVRKAVAGPERADARERAEESESLRRFSSFAGKVVLIYGSNDPDTSSASRGYGDLCRKDGIPHEIHRIEGANHSFYSLAWEREVIDLTSEWLKRQG